MFELFIYQLNNEHIFILCKHIICIMVYIYRFPKNETLKKKWIINMKLLDKESKTKLFVSGPASKICTSHFEEEYIDVENILL